MKNPKRTCTAAVSGSVRNIDRTLSFDIVSSSIIFFLFEQKSALVNVMMDVFCLDVGICISF